jgi:hypothetical protein
LFILGHFFGKKAAPSKKGADSFSAEQKCKETKNNNDRFCYQKMVVKAVFR